MMLFLFIFYFIGKIKSASLAKDSATGKHKYILLFNYNIGLLIDEIVEVMALLNMIQL